MLSKEISLWGLTRASELMVAVGLGLGVLISIVAMDAYPGYGLIYTVFCMVFLGMSTLAWVGSISYFYLFISTFWLLGFWMKASLHLIIGYDFIEPVGLFNGSGDAWDKALLVGIMAGLAAISFRLIQVFILQKISLRDNWELDVKNVPNWYKSFRKTVWCLSIVSIMVVAIINFQFSINQAGLIPLYVFPFKINAIIAGLLNTGFAFWIAALVWWDLSLGKGWWPRIIAIIFSGMMCSISILSRGFFVFQVFHYLPSIYFNRLKLSVSLRFCFLILFLFLLGMGFTATLTTAMRSSLYIGEPLALMSGAGGAVGETDVGHAFRKVLNLLSDRWVGLESVMAVSSYPDRDWAFFINGWSEQAKYDQKPVFEYIANSIYVDPSYPDAGKYNFLSLPGLIAMLNYADSLLIVFFGLFICLVFLGLCEYSIAVFIKNPFVLSFFGMYVAVLVSQFGSLGLVVIQLIEIFLVLMSLFFMQNHTNIFRVRKRL